MAEKKVKAWAVVYKDNNELIKTSTYAGHKIYHISIKKEKRSGSGYGCLINTETCKSIPCEIVFKGGL